MPFRFIAPSRSSIWGPSLDLRARGTFNPLLPWLRSRICTTTQNQAHADSQLTIVDTTYQVEYDNQGRVIEYQTTEEVADVSYDQWGNVVQTETEVDTTTYNNDGEIVETTEQETNVQYDEVRSFLTSPLSLNPSSHSVPKSNMLIPTQYGNFIGASNETEIQEWDENGNLIESVDQTTTVDEYGDVEVETDVVEADGYGGYTEQYEDDTYVNEGDGDYDGY